MDYYIKFLDKNINTLNPLIEKLSNENLNIFSNFKNIHKMIYYVFTIKNKEITKLSYYYSCLNKPKKITKVKDFIKKVLPKTNYSDIYLQIIINNPDLLK